jgi:plastocyanin
MRRVKQLHRRSFCGGLGVVLTAPALAASDPRRHLINISRFRYSVSDLTVRIGDIVVWHNLDSAPHTATEKAGAWDTGQIDRDQRGEIEFTALGHYQYYCAFHPNMTARLIVAE